MNIKQFVGAASLVSLSFVFGCGASHGRTAKTTPVGRSTTTGAVLCPEGFVTSTDGRSCVTPVETPANYSFSTP